MGKHQGKGQKDRCHGGSLYRPFSQAEEEHRIFYKQLGRVPLIGDFISTDICCKYNTAERKFFRRSLGCVEKSFLMQLVSELTSEITPLDLLSYCFFKSSLWGIFISEEYISVSDSF